jgi:hypothetical protein
MIVRKKVVVGAYVGKAVCDKLDALAAKLGISRSEAAGRLLEAALNKPGLAAEFARLEEEKKQRLIRYIM